MCAANVMFTYSGTYVPWYDDLYSNEVKCDLMHGKSTAEKGLDE